MKENFCCVAVILDASGSMAHLTSDTIGSFNTFLSEQKALPGEVAFTLCTFNTDYQLVHDFQKLASVPDLDAKVYHPRGGTALLDAMGTTIDAVGQKLSSLLEDQRPSKVVVLTITDGEENASDRYTLDQIKSMVKHQQEVYSWDFVFMGANIDAFSTGQGLGISTQNTMNYTATAAGTADLYSTVSRSLGSYRSSNSPRASFFDPGDALPIIVDSNGKPLTPPEGSSNGK